MPQKCRPTRIAWVYPRPPATRADPTGRVLGNVEAGALNYYAPQDGSATLAPNTVATAGGGQPHENMQPYLTLNFIIALQGIFPSQN